MYPNAKLGVVAFCASVLIAVCFILSFSKISVLQNSIKSLPETFSVMLAKITKPVLLYSYLVPGANEAGGANLLRYSIMSILFATLVLSQC